MGEKPQGEAIHSYRVDESGVPHVRKLVDRGPEIALDATDIEFNRMLGNSLPGAQGDNLESLLLRHKALDALEHILPETGDPLIILHAYQEGERYLACYNQGKFGECAPHYSALHKVKRSLIEQLREYGKTMKQFQRVLPTKSHPINSAIGKLAKSKQNALRVIEAIISELEPYNQDLQRRK